MIDNDPRDPATQAADFFHRPGHFHTVTITNIAPTDATCIIKFTDDQKPLVIEILRQLRGALNARITLTRCTTTQPPTPAPTRGRHHKPSPDDHTPPYREHFTDHIHDATYPGDDQ